MKEHWETAKLTRDLWKSNNPNSQLSKKDFLKNENQQKASEYITAYAGDEKNEFVVEQASYIVYAPSNMSENDVYNSIERDTKGNLSRAFRLRAKDWIEKNAKINLSKTQVGIRGIEKDASVNTLDPEILKKFIRKNSMYQASPTYQENNQVSVKKGKWRKNYRV
jgi:hypothetical protein